MKRDDMHPSQQELLKAVDGELSAGDAARVRAHLATCWACRARQQELEAAIGEFMRVHQRNACAPPSDGPRALLKAQLAQLAQKPAERWAPSFVWRLSFGWKLAAAACVLAAAAYGISHARVGTKTERAVIVTAPDPRLTPGATVFVSKAEVCRAENTKNKMVPVALRRQVFDEYGIAKAKPDAYEVDYLITPALGGADDIRNLWPESYTATAWNAQVKDALEDRLRDMVCDGQLDLETAQREIATDWIEAYKKYFHTDRPLP